MTPDQLAKANNEHSHQRALFAWANMAARYGFNAAWDDSSYSVKLHAETVYKPYPKACPPIEVLARLHAIPNGGYRDAITAGKLKAEGVKKGVPDVFLPLPYRDYGDTGAGPRTGDMMTKYCGLYVELKRPKTVKAGVRKAEIIDQAAGSTSEDQDGWIAYLRQAGYAVSVVFNWRDAAKDIQRYIEEAQR